MRLTKDNLENFYANAPELKLCSTQLFEVFFSMLLNLNFKGLDEMNSKIDASDSNGKLLDYELDDLCKSRDNLPNGLAYYVELISLNNRSINLTYVLWKHQENSYLGQEEIHYADDASIKSESDLLEFKKQLSLLLSSKINEELIFKDGKLKKYKYQFHHKEPNPVIFSNSTISLFSRKAEKIVSNTYEPWLEQ